MRILALRVPLLAVLVGVAALAMLIPASVALVEEDFSSARSFLYSTLLFMILALVVVFAAQGGQPAKSARTHLAGLIAAYLLLPLMLAVPLVDSVGNTRFFNGYFEMVSA